MSDHNDKLQQYVSDMLSLEKHIHDAIRRQRDSDKVKGHAQTHNLLSRAESILDEHIDHLEKHLDDVGGNSASPLKEAVSAVAGAAAGIYDQVRESQVSRMLRDDYTALSLAAISYTMLHTTGLALGSTNTADIALRHLHHWTPIIVEISEVIPLVVAQELAEDVSTINPTAGQESVRRTQEAWSREAV